MSEGLLIGMIFGLLIIIAIWIVALIIIIPKWKRYERKIKCTSHVEGTIAKLSSRGLGKPPIVYIDYEVDDVTYQVKDTLKPQSSAINEEKVPIDQSETSNIGGISVGATVDVYYDEENPKFAYVAGNKAKNNTKNA